MEIDKQLFMESREEKVSGCVDLPCDKCIEQKSNQQSKYGIIFSKISN